MSEKDDNEQKLAPAPRAEDTRWLRQTVGEPRQANVSKRPTLPPGLDGGAQARDQFVPSEPETISEPKYDEALITNEDNETEPVDTTHAEHATMVVIDLDVSVGIDDPDILAGISVIFSGLPTGAFLTAGEQGDDNSWVVPATLLDNLSIVITEDTGDFELLIVMDSDDDTPQSATIHVANDPPLNHDGKSFLVRLVPGPELSPVRLFVYLDGGIAFDRVLTWPGGLNTPTNITIPLLSGSLPFEILMRYDVVGEKKTDGPSLVGVDLEDTHVSSGSPAITVQGQVNDQGISWQGDLIIDVPGALKSATNVKSQTMTTPEPLPEPSSAIEPSGPADDPKQEPDIIDVNDVHEPEALKTETLEEQPSDILIVDASLDELKNSAFVEELRGLRDFIRGKSSDTEREVYERLGVDVSKWHDMSVRGPLGATVDLDPALPSLAPHGGRDNTRAPQKLKLPPMNTPHDLQVRITGVLPGALLTHGKNLGDGAWQLKVSDVEQVSIVPPVSQSKSASLQVSWQVRSSDGQETTAKRSILSSPVLPPLEYGNTDVRMMSICLDTKTFDPEGHGALSITVGDMPPGAMLTQGKNHGGGVWTLEATSDAMFELAASASMPLFLITLTCVALDSATGNSTVASHVVKVNPRTGAMVPRRTKAA